MLAGPGPKVPNAKGGMLGGKAGGGRAGSWIVDGPATGVTIVPLSTLIFSLYLLTTRPLSPPIPPDRLPDP